MASTQHYGNVLTLTNRLGVDRAHFSEKQAKQRDLLANLVRDLQSSLEIEEILNIFLNGLRNLFPLDGLSYSHEEAKINFSSAIQGSHKASYNLNSDHGDLGVLLFTRHRPFNNDELTLLENMMPCLLYPLRNCLKYSQAVTIATTDPLTECGNRQALDLAMRREMDLAKRDRTPLSVIMFDFDHFKRVNDQFGHQAGDQVLKQCCNQIKISMRKTDLLFRYGGEEFVILLHKTDEEGALKIAEKIREQIATTPICFQNSGIETSISLGVATLNDFEGISSLIERADKALYSAKRRGRNQVCCGNL